MPSWARIPGPHGGVRSEMRCRRLARVAAHPDVHLRLLGEERVMARFRDSSDPTVSGAADACGLAFGSVERFIRTRLRRRNVP
jgi:hypothetical protein